MSRAGGGGRTINLFATGVAHHLLGADARRSAGAELRHYLHPAD